MLMSDLTHRSLACKAHLNMPIENALYKFITITITITTQSASFLLNMDNWNNLILHAGKSPRHTDVQIIKGLSPASVPPEFISTPSTQCNLKVSEAKLELPMPGTNYWKRAFCYSGTMLWIRLLVGLRIVDSLGYLSGETDQLYSSCRSGSHMTIL